MDVLKKHCSRCKIEKPIAYFSISVHGKYGRKSHCKECYSLYHQEYKQRKGIQNKSYECIKPCRFCLINKKIMNNRVVCAECRQLYKSLAFFDEKYHMQYLMLRQKNAPKIQRETKICSKCHEEKSMDLFFKMSYNKDGYNGVCKLCKGSVPFEKVQCEECLEFLHPHEFMVYDSTRYDERICNTCRTQIDKKIESQLAMILKK